MEIDEVRKRGGWKEEFPIDLDSLRKDLDDELSSWLAGLEWKCWKNRNLWNYWRKRRGLRYKIEWSKRHRDLEKET